MTNLTYKTVAKGADVLAVSVYDNGVFIHTFDLDREDAKRLAQSVMGALDGGAEPTADELMLADLRAAMNGVRVTIGDEPYAVLNEAAKAQTGEEHDKVYLAPGSEATILSWDEFAERSFFGSNETYDEDANFPLLADNGMVQVVALDSCTPVDRDAVSKAARAVGARWAEPRGIVPGAKVILPPTTLIGVLFGEGEVETVDGGVVTVRVEAADTSEEYLVTSLFLA